MPRPEASSQKINVVPSYRPNASQLKFHTAVEKFSESMYVGGFGSGKTKAVVEQAIDLCLRFPGVVGAIFRDTMQDLKDTIMQTFFESCSEDVKHGYRKREETVMFENSSKLMFRSFRMYKTSARNQFEGKIKGMNLGFFGIDEANESTDDQWKLLLGRLRHHAIPFHRGFGATNPPDKSHWIYTRFTDPKAAELGRALVQASTYDNEENLPADYIESLLRSYPESWVKRYVRGEFGTVMRGDPFYEEFIDYMDNDLNRPWHCRKLIYMHHRPVLRFWDFGFHRPAVCWAQLDVEGRLKVQRELMGRNESIFTFAPRVVEATTTNFPGSDVEDYGDFAGQQKSDKEVADRSTIDILKEEFKIDIIRKYSHIQTGADIIQRLLKTTIQGEPALQIDPEGCPILVDAFKGGYSSEKPTDGKGMIARVAIKDGHYEHLCDALRYGVGSIFGSSKLNRVKFDTEIPRPYYGFSKPNTQSIPQSAPALTGHSSRGWVLNP